MNRLLFFLLFLLSSFTTAEPAASRQSELVIKKNKEDESKVAIAIHGGAGTILKRNLSADIEQAYHKVLKQALRRGYHVLTRGGSSVEAVQATIVVLENSELFNAGKGAVFTHHKTNELDASIMEGKTLNAGAVTGVEHVKNPILLAHAVMTKSSHVMLSGPRAEVFAKEQGLELVDKKYFHTDRRWQQLMKLLNENPDKTQLSENKDDKLSSILQDEKWPDDKKFGTVGAVALDKHGNLAAGTSTGGLTNKKYGRIGDSPIIGAGTYADNNACAVSATGKGEYFIRAAVAHDICARVLYKKISLQRAADEVILDKLVTMRGSGGVVALTPEGKPVFSFNTKGMYRGFIDTDGKIKTFIYK